MANPSLDGIGITNLPNQVCERIFALPALHTDASNRDRHKIVAKCGEHFTIMVVGAFPIHLEMKLC
jgi:hypothetical protein